MRDIHTLLMDDQACLVRASIDVKIKAKESELCGNLVSGVVIS